MFKYIGRMLFIFYLNLQKKSKVSYSASVNFKTELEGFNTFHRGSVLSGSKVGFASFVGRDSFLPNSKIGRYCSIAHNVEVITHTHPSSNFVSTHPSFYSLLEQSGFTFVDRQKFSERLTVNNAEMHSVEIGSDVWIGAHALIMGGVRIGAGAIIAAGSVVITDVPPYAIVGGIPAKIIRMRFSNDEIEYLLHLSWWKNDYAWMKINAKYFTDIKTLKTGLNNPLCDATKINKSPAHI